MPIARANPQFNVIKEFGSDGELAFIEVDYINDVSAETGDFDAGDSAVCALGMVQRAIEQTCNILGKGPLTDSDTRQTFIVRADTLSRDVDGSGGVQYNAVEAVLQTAVRAVDSFRGSTPGTTANISAATVSVKALDLQAAATEDSTAAN
jgi:hypothetical protein|tara:strand:- start:709 stop:1158 length:450 start_codon:yes stop_codon:yes gene_type:complete